MLLRPTRVRVKPARFHISAPEYTKNAPDFTFPNRDTPKPRPVLHPNLRRGTFRSICFCALHGYAQNLAGFRPKPSARDFSGRMQYAPTRVRAKFGGFHISTPGYTKNAPGFTLPNKDIPKTRPVLGPNLWRGFFRGVCFCALHGYMKNLAGFIFPHTDTPKTHPVLGLNLRRGTFRGVCNTPLHGYMKNLAGFIVPHTDAPKTHPILPSQIGIRPKPTRFYT